MAYYCNVRVDTIHIAMNTVFKEIYSLAEYRRETTEKFEKQ